MLFIIRKKNNHKAVFSQRFPERQAGMNPTSVYPDFDSTHMEAAWHHDEVPPQFFEITDEGMAQPLPIPDTIEANGQHHFLGYKTVKGKAVSRTLKDMVESGDITINTPFEQVKGDKIVRLSNGEVAKKDAVRTLEEAENYLKVVKREMLGEITDAYTTPDELKRTKAYLDWLNDGKPKNDARKAAYDEMQQVINDIKAKYAKAKAYGKAKLAELSQPAAPTASQTKAEITAWLDAQGIAYQKSDSKKKLLEIVKSNG